MNDEMAVMSYSSKLPHVINLSNGIIGVSILAMPFCMKQCGLLFGTIVLIGTSILTRLSCDLLMKGAYFTRNQSYESFALQTMGPLGKMAVEIFMILYTKGTLIAFFVIIGDLGPLILSDFIGESIGDRRETIRVLFMAIVALFIILPLSLLRHLGSLSRISSLAILFYGFLVLRIFVQSVPKLLSTEWWGEVTWWQPTGFVQTLPIFALSLSCQTQLFVMTSEMPDWTPVKMDGIVKSALNLCSGIYFMVGIFGYIAFHNQTIGGDVLVLLDNSGLTKFVKTGFLLSLAVSYPIMIFPCRSAIYSMIFKRNGMFVSGEFGHHDHQIPPTALKAITVYLICFNLLIAIWIPDVELILALCGSLVGSLICFVMPGLLFYLVWPKKDAIPRFLAQVCIGVGLFALIFSTYASLRDVHATDGHQKPSQTLHDEVTVPKANSLERHPMPFPEEQVVAVKRAANLLSTIPPLEFEIRSEQRLVESIRDQVPKELSKNDVLKAAKDSNERKPKNAPDSAKAIETARATVVISPQPMVKLKPTVRQARVNGSNNAAAAGEV